MKILSPFSSLTRGMIAALCAALLQMVPLSASSALPWWKEYDPDLTVMQNPTIKTLYSNDFSEGFFMTGISDFRDFNTFQTTALGARFDSEGNLRWAAFLEGGSGSRLQRVEGLSDLEHFFAGQLSSGKIRAGVYNGLTMEKRFAHEFDLRAVSGDARDVVIGLFDGDIIGIAQHLADGVVHVMLMDKDGNVLVDRNYSGLTSPFDSDPSYTPEVLLQRLPDKSGFLLVTIGHVVCLENNGDIRWARRGPFSPGILPPVIGPDGSVVYTLPWPATEQTPEGAVVLVKLNGDGSFAWARMIEGIVPETDRFLMGRNPVHDGENIWLAGSDLADVPFTTTPGNTFVALVRIDAVTGDIIAQADISMEDWWVIGEFAGWTGTHAFFSIDSYNNPLASWARTGNLLKVDGNFENPELRNIHASVETTRVSYDAASDSLLYTSTDGNGRWISAASLDAATLEPGGSCQPFMPPEPVDFTHTPATRESVPFTDLPPIEEPTLTFAEAGTVLSPTDFSLAPLTFSVMDGCLAGVPPVFFTDWAGETFGPDAGNPAVAGPGVDLTGDGVTNLQAFVFGLDPRANNPSPGILPAQDSTGFTVTFRVRGNLPFGTLSIEGSYDMVDWTAPLQIEASPPDGDGLVTVTVRLGEPPAVSQEGFVRIGVAEVEP